MAGFRFKRSVLVSYDRQGYIYFYSRAYRSLPRKEQQWIEKLCREAGGEHHRALLEFVTTDLGARCVCSRHYLSESTLERAVRRYYVLFDEGL